MTASVQPQPDPMAVWLSHLLVGAAFAAVVGKQSGASAALLAAAAATAVHQVLDAPVAKLLSSAGV